MSRWAISLLLASVFVPGILFRGEWVKVSILGFALGFLIAFIAWRRDRLLRDIGDYGRWAILKFWAIGSFLAAPIFAISAYGLGGKDVLVSGAGAFAGVGLAALITEMQARQRSLA